MRLRSRLTAIAAAIGIELCILALVGLVFLFQFSKEKEELVDKSKAIAETIGDQASSFFSLRGSETTSNEFFLFLDDRLGRKKLFNTFEIAPKFFSVVFKKDVESGKASGYFMDDFYPEGGYSVKKDNGMISVSVPFTIQGKTEPFGIVEIDSDTETIVKKVLADNFLLYAAILVVFNNQAFIFYLLLRRKKEVVFEKGYLKEHSIGALKIMHRVLGDIIEDHKREFVEETGKKQDSSKKVISLSELVDKRKK
ncbi:MAG TPA: hypothetical protein VLB01_01520 [Thermodesulfobacteriota bacterium]|nr:hypothetical protein [Thermodesulfobacteriota bacterium]